MIFNCSLAKNRQKKTQIITKEKKIILIMKEEYFRVWIEIADNNRLTKNCYYKNKVRKGRFNITPEMIKFMMMMQEKNR